MNTGTFNRSLTALGCALVAFSQGQGAWAASGDDGAGVAGVSLSPAEAAACSEEIRRTRVRWKYWPGDAGHAVARLGAFQKELFEGRCAGHPQAQAYIAVGNRMLGLARAAGYNTDAPADLSAAKGPPAVISRR